ncbi:MAG: hypothetical protein WA892_14075 [Ornithinimicrobium sp.]
MVIEYQRMQSSHLDDRFAESITTVDDLAKHLRAALEVQKDAIDSAHVHGASSREVQQVVSAVLKQLLGFDEEVLLTAEDGIVSRPRPDFVYQIGPGEGVIAEVERGGTVANNHDPKDIWMTRIAPDPQHLFRIVPSSNWRGDTQSRERPFPRLAHRMGALFGDSRREIDVLTCHVFGYGRRA